MHQKIWEASKILMLGPHMVSQPLKPGVSELQGFFLCTMNFLRKKTSPKCSVDKGSIRKKKMGLWGIKVKLESWLLQEMQKMLSRGKKGCWRWTHMGSCFFSLCLKWQIAHCHILCCADNCSFSRDKMQNTSQTLRGKQWCFLCLSPLGSVLFKVLNFLYIDPHKYWDLLIWRFS